MAAWYYSKAEAASVAWCGVAWCGGVSRHETQDTLRVHTGPGASTASTECLEWRFVLRSTPSRNNLPIQKH